jgi:hypothetical protein
VTRIVTYVHRLWKRFVATQWGKLVVLCVVPFLARPSEFTRRANPRTYGKVFALASLPAWLYSAAFAKMAVNFFQHQDLQMTPSEAIAVSQRYESWSSWSAKVVFYLLVILVAGLRWIWHVCLRKWTNRYRTDGQTAGEAPFSFFVIHTAGWASWMAVWTMIIAIVDSFYPGHRFAAIQDFLDTHYDLHLGLGALVILAIFKLCRSNTANLLEIYKAPAIVWRVRWVTYIALVVMVPVVFAGLIAMLAHLAHMASMPPTDGGALPTTR